METLNTTDESRMVRFEGKTGQYWVLKREAASALRGKMTPKYVKSVRQWRDTVCQLNLAPPTTESGQCSHLDPHTVLHRESG